MESINESNSGPSLVGGAQVNIESLTVSQHTAVSSQTQAPKSARYKRSCKKRFLSKVNEACLNDARQNVVSNFCAADLVEPEKESFPGLLQVDFYRGIVNEPGEGQYAPECNFATSAEKWNGNKIEFQNIHAPVGKDRCRCASLVGGAGSGKTTLLKRYARGVLEKRIALGVKNKRSHCLKRQNGLLVHFINVKNLPDGGNFTPRDLLFKEMVKELDNDELEIGFEDLKNHHGRCLFVIDGLDQYDWELEKERRKIGYFDEASVSCIMFNLLTGELFPNAWILTSSRPHKIRFFKDKLRADKMISLTGFEQKDIEYLTNEIPRTDKTVFKRLKERCPNLLILCRTPLFLIFTILVFVERKDFSCDTMAAVMAVLIQSFGKSPHWTSGEYKNIFKKLRHLAFKGTVDKRVIFKQADFLAVDLSFDIANDLFICVPKKTPILIREKMLEGDFVMFFCHQSVQEAFCSLYIFELPVDDFARFINVNINDPHYSVVRRLLCGILLNDETLALAKDLVSVTHLDEKRNILLNALKDEVLRESSRPRELMDLFCALNEAGSGADVLFVAFPQRISICREPLTAADAYILGKTLGKLSFLDILELWDTKIDRGHMELLWNEIKKSRLKIRKMDLHSNYQHDFDFGLLGNILQHCDVEDLDVNDCRITDGKLKKFRSVRCEKLKKLAISKNGKIGASGFSSVGRIISSSQEFNELKIDNCKLTKAKIRALRKSLCGKKIEKLDINYNRRMGNRGARIMGIMIRECRTDQLDMSRCDQSASEIKSFTKGLKETQLKSLSITTHELRKLVTRKYLPAIEGLLPHVQDRLEMLDWDIPFENLASMQQMVNAHCRQGFKLVYSSLPGKDITPGSSE